MGCFMSKNSHIEDSSPLCSNIIKPFSLQKNKNTTFTVSYI